MSSMSGLRLGRGSSQANWIATHTLPTPSIDEKSSSRHRNRISEANREETFNRAGNKAKDIHIQTFVRGSGENGDQVPLRCENTVKAMDNGPRKGVKK